MSFFKSLFEDETQFDFNHDDAPNYDGGTCPLIVCVNGPGGERRSVRSSGTRATTCEDALTCLCICACLYYYLCFDTPLGA